MFLSLAKIYTYPSCMHPSSDRNKRVIHAYKEACRIAKMDRSINNLFYFTCLCGYADFRGKILGQKEEACKILSEVLSTPLRHDNDIIVGDLSSLNCPEREKVSEMKEMLKSLQRNNDREEYVPRDSQSCFYSDPTHVSYDYPL